MDNLRQISDYSANERMDIHELLNEITHQRWSFVKENEFSQVMCFQLSLTVVQDDIRLSIHKNLYKNDMPLVKMDMWYDDTSLPRKFVLVINKCDLNALIALQQKPQQRTPVAAP